MANPCGCPPGKGRKFTGQLPLSQPTLKVYFSKGRPGIYLCGPDAHLTAFKEQVSRLLAVEVGSFGPVGGVNRLRFTGDSAFLALELLDLEPPVEWSSRASKPHRVRSGARLSDEHILACAKKCQTRTEWHIRFFAHRREVLLHRQHLMDRCVAHMVRVNHAEGPVYSVYAYEFEDGFVYVGLSRNLSRRRYGHRAKPGILHRHAGKGYAFRVISSGLLSAQAQDLECNTIDVYKAQGWKILNRNRGGALGSKISRRFSLEQLVAITSGLTRKQFREDKKYRSAFLFAYRKGLLPQLSTINNWPPHWSYHHACR